MSCFQYLNFNLLYLGITMTINIISIWNIQYNV